MTNISKALAVSLLSGAFSLTHRRVRPEQHDAADHGDAPHRAGPELASQRHRPARLDHPDHRADQHRSEGSGDEPEGEGQGRPAGEITWRSQTFCHRQGGACSGQDEFVARVTISSHRKMRRTLPSAAFAPPALRYFRSARGAYFFSANTQTTPPCGTLASMPILLVASASWMRCASTPQPDWIAMYCVPSIS